MARRTRVTPFDQWLRANGLDAAALAAEMGEGEGRIRHYVKGRAIPKPEMLRKLTARTGLPSDAFLFPFDYRPEAA